MSAALAIVLAIICLAGGGLLGFLLGRGGGSNKKRAEALEQEFEDYKRNVTEHFGKTAEHFQSMGRQYRELYEHMASGAGTLCDSDDRTRLAFPSLLTIEAVAETPAEAEAEPEAEPTLDSASAEEREADAAGDGPAAAEDTPSADAPETTEAATDESASGPTTPETSTPDEATQNDADDDRAAAADDSSRTASDATGDADELKVEVEVEVVDDEPGTERDAAGATPFADTADLDPADDAGATRH